MRCQSKIEGQRLDIVQLHTEREDLGRQLEYVQGMLAEASITVDVDQHHLADLQRSLDDMHENLQRSKRERDTYKRQAQRQKAAYEDEIRAAHHKLMDLQRALTRETDARRNAQEKLKQTSGQLTQQRAHLEEVVIQQRSAERSLNESTELLGMHTSLHDDNSRHRQDSHKIIQRLEGQLAEAKVQLAEKDEARGKLQEEKEKLLTEMRRREFRHQNSEVRNSQKRGLTSAAGRGGSPGRRRDSGPIPSLGS